MNLRGQHVVIMGLGGFGGGAGAARYCADQGATVLVTDTAPAAQLTAAVTSLQDVPLQWRLGEHREEDFLQADIVVVNPAVSPNNDFVAIAWQNGAIITTEIELLLKALPNPRRVIGITGSAGKSTTTAMVGHALAAVAGDEHVHVGGNLGGSLLPHLGRIAPDDWVVLELSSFMLYRLLSSLWSPPIAAITSFAPNHLDWHGSLEGYQTAKDVILEQQDDGLGDVAILGPGVRDHFQPRVSQVVDIPASPGDAWLDAIHLPGSHNRVNATIAAAIISAALGTLPDAAREAIIHFPGLPHRLQFVCEHRDVRFYNDSKATTPAAAILAMQAFPPGGVHVILGGYDKQMDLTAMARLAAAHCKGIYTIGATGPGIARTARAAISAEGSSASCATATIHECGDLEQAMALIVTQVRQGDVVLLSPGCASWGQFVNYEARGRLFSELAMRFTGEGSPNPPAADASR